MVVQRVVVEGSLNLRVSFYIIKKLYKVKTSLLINRTMLIFKE